MNLLVVLYLVWGLLIYLNRGDESKGLKGREGMGDGGRN